MEADQEAVGRPESGQPAAHRVVSAVRVEVLSWIARGLGGQREDKAVWQEPIAEGQTLGELMDSLAARHPSFAGFYDPATRTLQDHVELVLNGRLFDLAGGFEARLQPGDTVMLFPGYAGG